MDVYLWYEMLAKPLWAPPSWIFGPVWSGLYVIIAITFGYVGYGYITKKYNRQIALPFALNLIANVLYTPLMFTVHSILLATLDILVVLGTLIWALMRMYPHARWVSLLNIPYLLWVVFATFLQITILILNF